MIAVLFDIDGTLLHTGGAGKLAFQRTLSQDFGIDDYHDVEVHGRTDRAIISDLFAAVGIDLSPPTWQRFTDEYTRRLPGCLAESRGTCLPGVGELLQRLDSSSNIGVGLLTGNMEQAARHKLDHFGLSEFFAFGGFGDRHASRNLVAVEAKASARLSLGDRFTDQDLWVVGDTIHDVNCARHIRAKSILVQTGGSPCAVDAKSSADACVDDLSDCDSILQLIGL